MSRKTARQAPKIPSTPSRRRDVWGIILLSVYLLALAWVVVCKAEFHLPTVRDERVLNIIPFYYNVTWEGENPFLEAFLNVLAFIPLGAYLTMLGVRGRRTVLCGFLLSFVFELMQFIFAIGVSDVTDLITNTTGTVIGWGVYALLRRLCRKRRHFPRAMHIAATVCTGLAGIAFIDLVIDTIKFGRWTWML